MSKVWIARFSCIAVSIISMIVMGAHLFLGDGIKSPSPLVEITGVLALAGCAERLTHNNIIQIVDSKLLIIAL